MYRYEILKSDGSLYDPPFVGVYGVDGTIANALRGLLRDDALLMGLTVRYHNASKPPMVVHLPFDTMVSANLNIVLEVVEHGNVKFKIRFF